MDIKEIRGWLDNLANNEDWTADGMRLYAKEALEVLDEIYFNNKSIEINNDEDELDNLFDDLKEYYNSKVTDIYNTYENKDINEKRKLSELTVNDKVYVDCMSSLGASSCGYSLISEVVKKFDENTGEEYKVFLVDDRKFDSRNGSEIRKDGIGMFYIESV